MDRWYEVRKQAIPRETEIKTAVSNGMLNRLDQFSEPSNYEVRTWNGWYHHQTLTLIAAWFLVREMSRGKKVYSGPRGSPDSPISALNHQEYLAN